MYNQPGDVMRNGYVLAERELYADAAIAPSNSQVLFHLLVFFFLFFFLQNTRRESA